MIYVVIWSGYQDRECDLTTLSVTQSMFLFTFEISVCERTISVGMTIFGLQKRLCTLIDAHGSGQQCFEVFLFYRAIILSTQHNSSGTYIATSIDCCYRGIILTVFGFVH